MHTGRTIQPAIRARVNSQVLTVILFGLAVIAVAIVFILGGEDTVSDEGVLTGSRQEGARDSITEIIESEEAAASIEGHRPEKERLESFRTSISSGVPEGHVTLRGLVIHEDGIAVQGAKVRAVLIQSMLKTLRPEDYLSFKTQSTEGGHFEFDHVPMGKYSLVASSGNLGGHTEAFVVDPRRHPTALSREHEIVLKQVGMIAGRVTGPDGEPVPGATIMPYPMTACFVRADDQGKFVLNDLKIGFYMLQAVAPGLVGKTVNGIRIGTTDVEITLVEGGSIRGTVSLDGKPIAGITVTTDDGRSRRNIPIETVTGKDGRYELSPLGKSWISPRVLSDEFTDPESKSIDLAEGEHLDNINFQLSQNGSLTGRVTDAKSGDPVEGIWVCAVPENSSLYMLLDRYYPGQNKTFALTDSNGHYEISCCSTVGLTVVTRGGMGYSPAPWENGNKIKLAPGEHKDGVDFQLQHGPALVVKIRTDAGDPVTGAKVTLKNADQINLTGDIFLLAALIPGVIEEPTGCYVFNGFPTGVFELEVMKRGWTRTQETFTVTKEEDTLELKIHLSPSLTVQGRVLDPGEKGVKNAFVNFGHDRYDYMLTAEDGSFVAQDVSAGQCNIAVVAEGYLALSKRINIEKNSAPLELILEPEGSHFLAGVVRNDLGEVLPGVTVRIFQYDANNHLNKTAETKEDGTFSLTGLLEGRIQVDIDSEKGFLKDRIQNDSLDRNDLEITLQRFAHIKGRVIDSSGVPVKRFSLQPSRKGGGKFSPPKSFSNGEFDHDKVPPGEVTLLISMGKGNQSETGPYILAPGEVREGVSITLKEMGTLTGIIKEKATSKPINGASIRIHESKNDPFPLMFLRHAPAKATTEEDGSFIIDKQKSGIMDVYASHPDYAEGCLKQVEVLSGGTTGPIEILLDRGGVIRGQVIVDGQGKAGIEIEAKKQNPHQQFQTVTGTDGRYEIKGLSPAEYEVSATLRNDAKHISVHRTIQAKVGETVDCDLQFTQGGSLEGMIYVLGKPLGGVRINVSTARGSDQNADLQSIRVMGNESEQDGSYRIEGLGPGRYHILTNHRAKKRTFSFQKDIEVRLGINVFDIRMGEEGSCEVLGFVYENDTPAANVDVSISAGGSHSRVTTGSDGAFRFHNLSAGKAHLYASMTKGDTRNHFRVSKPLELIEGETIREDLRFATGSGVLFGEVRENGATVSDTVVQLEGDAADGSGKVSMVHFSGMWGDANYRFEFLPAGRYELSLSRPLNIKQEVFLKVTEELQVDIDISTGSGSIQGTVKTPGDDEESGAVGVYLFKPGTCTWQEGKTFQVLSLNDGLMASIYVSKGKFSQDHLPAGTFDVVAVRHKDEAVLKLDIRRIILAEGESKTIDLDVVKE